MNTNIKAVINLMQTLGVTLEELISSLPSKDVLETLQTCIANDSINLQILFSSESEAFEKLVEFVGSEDFGTPPKIPEQDTKQIATTHSLHTSQTPKIPEKATKQIATAHSLHASQTPKIPEKAAKQIEYAVTSNGMTYAKYEGKVLGLVFNSSSNGKFIFALRNHGYNIPFKVARKEAELLPEVAGKKWCVPSDSHFKAIQQYGVTKINNALKELRGDEINRTGFLSSTSQANQPSRWCVRFILPLN